MTETEEFLTSEPIELFMKEMLNHAPLVLAGCAPPIDLSSTFAFMVMPVLPPWPPLNRIRYWPEGSVGFVSNRQAEIWMMDPEIYRE